MSFGTAGAFDSDPEITGTGWRAARRECKSCERYIVMERPVISVWGDSIGKGIMFDTARNRHVICRDSYEASLKQHGIEVHNYAVMGCTAPKGVTLMTEDRLKHGGVAVIEFGGNDCDLDWKGVCEEPEKSAEKFVKVTLPDFRAALAQMVEKARAAGLRPILSTPLPVIADRYFEWISKPFDRQRILDYLGAAEYIYRWQERYDIAVRETAAKLNVKLFDIRTRFLQERRIGDFMSIDGIHPNEKGHAIIRETALEYLPALV